MSDDELREAQLRLLGEPLDTPAAMALYNVLAVELKVRDALRRARHPESEPKRPAA